MPDPDEHTAQPLAGIRVLDLSGDMDVYCGKLLADVGADVIKVEPPGGDYMRQTGPFISRDSPDQTNFPGYSSFWDTAKYNPAFQGRQMRSDAA